MNTDNLEYKRKYEDVYELKRKSLSSLHLEKVPSGFTDLHVVCDVFYIQSDLSSKFRGKNLAIVANYVEVQKPSTFDISGLPVTHVFEYDAGQKEDGSGRDGLDGYVGKSGGNFAMSCKFLENGSIFTIISNGSDGTNGQNGGNGKDGMNGKDATRSSFVKEGFDWRMKFAIGQKYEMNRIFNLENFEKSEVTTDDGSTAYVFKQISLFEDWGIMLVKGGSGQPGKQGGCGGFGGAGGYPGSINIQCDQSAFPSNIQTVSNIGNNGQTGIGGFNGFNGVEGRDLWKYDQRHYANAEFFGESEHKKYKLIWGENVNYSIWDGEKNEYVRVEEDYDIKEPTLKSRNTLFKDKSVDKPEYVASFNFATILNEYLPFLKNKKNDSIKKIEMKSNSKIDQGININITLNFLPSVF